MSPPIRVAILDDHQSIIDGYQLRLGKLPDFEIVATAYYGEELEPMLAAYPTDVLVLDVTVPASATNPNPYPILHLIPKLLQRYPTLVVLVVSMHDDRALIQAVIEAGASGYILKDDREAIVDLAAVVRTVAHGGIYFSRQAHQQLRQYGAAPDEPLLTQRQLEVLSMCAAYPNLSTSDLAQKLNIANSTMRNLLSEAYLRLQVINRTAAIAKARQLGLITPYPKPVVV
jgi:DNA-binding NarL/FixJ family response regulator